MEQRFDLPISQLRLLAGYQGVEPRDFRVYFGATMKAPRNNAVMFLKDMPKGGLDGLLEVSECLLLVKDEVAEAFSALRGRNLVVPVANPRLEFARVTDFATNATNEQRRYHTLPNGAVVGENVRLGEGVQIEPLAFVDHGVSIGARSIVRAGARVLRYVSVGADTVIRENSIIGGPGFGFERAEDGTPIRLPHLGGVIIGDRVEIGALNTVVSGTIDPTIIEDDVKTDDHVHIAHNCLIRRGCLVTACAELSGSVEVGEYSWLGPNCSIMNGITLGSHSFIGLGAVVTKSVAASTTVAGNPADTVPNLKAWIRTRARLQKAVDEGRV